MYKDVSVPYATTDINFGRLKVANQNKFLKLKKNTIQIKINGVRHFEGKSVRKIQVKHL